MRLRVPPPVELINMHTGRSFAGAGSPRAPRQGNRTSSTARTAQRSGRRMHSAGTERSACSQICGPSSSAPLRVLPALTIAGKRVLAVGPPLLSCRERAFLAIRGSYHPCPRHRARGRRLASRLVQACAEEQARAYRVGMRYRARRRLRRRWGFPCWSRVLRRQGRRYRRVRAERPGDRASARPSVCTAASAS